MRKKKWFKKAVMDKPPYDLGGWNKSQSTLVRRAKAIASRPDTMNLRTKRLSVARALQALANVTKDKMTKELAQVDANYFYRLLK